MTRTTELIVHPDWHIRAACRGHTNTMFDEMQVNEALRFCRGCPVIDDCARDHDDETWGTWAGRWRGRYVPKTRGLYRICPDCGMWNGGKKANARCDDCRVIANSEAQSRHRAKRRAC